MKTFAFALGRHVVGPSLAFLLASVALGRPLLLVVVEHMARLNPERRSEIEARLADPRRRRALRTLTMCVGLTLAIDGASQVVLALTVPTSRFVPDSTAVRILVLGSGVALTVSYLRHHTGQRRRTQ